MLKEKVIIVTGGSGLIGKALISEIKAQGGVAINADISVETDLENGMVKCDATSVDSMEETVKAVVDHYGQIDGLVNNAYPRTEDWGTKFEEMSPESLNKNINWQLSGYMSFCKVVLPYMEKQQSGSIVNMSSIYGIVGNDFGIYEGTNMEPSAAYSAIKGGLINFSRFLASKYARYGVRINCVSPGGIFDHQPSSFVEAYNQKVPMKRMGLPEDIAPPVVFLLSDGAGYVTGQNLAVDGGWTCI